MKRSLLFVLAFFTSIGISFSQNLVVNNGESVDISADATYVNVTLNSGCHITIDANVTLTVTGILTNSGSNTITNNGVIVLASSASGTARISGTVGGLENGVVTVQQYIPGGARHFRFLSHPFNTALPLSILTNDIDITGAGGATNGFTTTATNNPSAFYFDPNNSNGNSTNDGGWTAFTDATTANWGQAQGIRVLIRGTKGQTGTLDGTNATPNDVTLNMTGHLQNTGTAVWVNLLTNGTGFNLIGNPYPTPVNIGGLVYGNTDLSQTIYVREPQTSSYVTVNLTSITTPSPGYYVIPGSSAVFVQATGGSNPHIIFTEGSWADCSSCTTTVFGNSSSNYMQFKVTDNKGIQYDNMYVKFNDNSNSSYEKGIDASKLTNDIFNLYSVSSDNKSLAVDSRKMDGQTIKLGLSLAKSAGEQTYTISASDFNIDNTNYDLYLNDKLTGTSTLLQKGTAYKITLNGNDTATVGENRLSIVMVSKNKISLNPDDNGDNKNLSVSLEGNPVHDAIVINYKAKDAGNTTALLVNAGGQIVQKVDAGVQQQGKITIPVSQYPQGFYIMKLNVGNNSVVKKIIKE